MPFISKDWRSPGEAWVKTDEGWERKKNLEQLNRNMKKSSKTSKYSRKFALDSDGSTDSSDSDSESKIKTTACTASEKCQKRRETHLWQPHFPITIKSTREVAGYNTISEAFRRLDFRNGVKDIRRFNYICKLIHLIISQNLTTLSGCATKVLFVLLEEVAGQVASNQQNIHMLQAILYDLKKTMRKYYCWGRPLGSTLLWEQHLQTIERICMFASNIKIKEPKDDGSLKLTHLPAELIREILLRLCDYRDLINSGQAYSVMQGLINEQYIWRQLCYFHFTLQQVHHALDCYKSKSGHPIKLDWQGVFHHLRKVFGLKEEYADCLFLCRHCRCLFWKSFGHPCIDTTLQHTREVSEMANGEEEIEDKVSVPECIPVPPQAFLKFFSL
ncbi:F-box only protein 32-like isoform X1 [Limulus polyphemus]|uniref:F-box only protein 32-like isoform X1 n=1 Tax=Limulus polyphemus TaxID=6850 RepID=A0ABM1SBA7_LIMPO|nr:F-box only protein 32-like isoform X1 [Limulus polyphemus]